METRNKGLIIFGIVLLAIGLGLALYHRTEMEDNNLATVDLGYPYQALGIGLLVTGMVFVALGFLLQLPHRTPPPSHSQQPSSS